jgi:hypothetical protein
MQTTGKPPGPMLRARARARLEGKAPAPPFPDPSKVSPERMKQIIDAASRLKPMPLVKFVKALPQDEIAAWRDWAMLAMRSPEPPAFLLSARNILTGFDSPVDDVRSIYPPSCTKFPSASPFKTGDDLGDAKSLRRLCTEILLRAEQLSPASFQISRQHLGIGSEILCIHFDFSDPVLSLPRARYYLKARFEKAASLLAEHESWPAVLVVTLHAIPSGKEMATPTTLTFHLDSKGTMVSAGSPAPNGEDPDSRSDPIDWIASRLTSPESRWDTLTITVFARKDLEPFGAWKER